MIPRHPSGALLSKSDPVGAAGKRAPVAVSTSTSSPARSFAVFKARAWLSGILAPDAGSVKRSGSQVAENDEQGRAATLLGVSHQRISSHDRFTIEPLKIHGLTRIGIVDS